MTWTARDEAEYQEQRRNESERIANGYRSRGQSEAAERQDRDTERFEREKEKAEERDNRK